VAPFKQLRVGKRLEHSAKLLSISRFFFLSFTKEKGHRGSPAAIPATSSRVVENRSGAELMGPLNAELVAPFKQLRVGKR